jgi:hypothetical protein
VPSKTHKITKKNHTTSANKTQDMEPEPRLILTRSKAIHEQQAVPATVAQNISIEFDYRPYYPESIRASFDTSKFLSIVDEQLLKRLTNELKTNDQVIAAQAEGHVQKLISLLEPTQQLGLLLRGGYITIDEYTKNKSQFVNTVFLMKNSVSKADQYTTYLMYYPMSDVHRQVASNRVQVEPSQFVSGTRKNHVNHVIDSSKYWNGIIAVGQGTLDGRHYSHEQIGNSSYMSPFDYSSSVANIVREVADAPVLMVPIVYCDPTDLFYFECILIQALKTDVRTLEGGGNFQLFSPQNKTKRPREPKVSAESEERVPEKDPILYANIGKSVLSKKSEKSTSETRMYAINYENDGELKKYHIATPVDMSSSKAHVWLRIDTKTLYCYDVRQPRDWSKKHKQWIPYHYSR